MLNRTIYAFFTACLLLATEAFAFGPCQRSMPQGLSYLPSVAACGGKAAIVLMGNYYNSFSVVLRDCNNNDRDPCHKDVDSCATYYSSPFKTIKMVEAIVRKNKRLRKARIACFRERGSSAVYKLVRRFTIKKTNPVRKPSDIVKICLSTRTKAVGPLKIVSTSRSWIPRGDTWTPVCETQGYLNCDISYKAICPQY